jgi:ferredoxin
LPWIKEENCIGCGICVNECPVNAISLIDEIAEINMDECIRCGICHDVCPQDAVRHDSEKIPQEVEANIEWTKELLKHYKTKKDREAFINRIEKHFMKEQKVTEKTLEWLKSFKENIH